MLAHLTLSEFAEIISSCECFYDLGMWSADWLAQTAYNLLYNHLKRSELGNYSGGVSDYISDVIHVYLDHKMGIKE